MIEKEILSPILKDFQTQWKKLSQIKNKGLDGFKSVEILLTKSLEDRLIYYLPFKSNQLLIHYSELKKRKLSNFQIIHELNKSLVLGSFGKYSDNEKLDFGINLIFILITKGRFAIKQKLFSVSLHGSRKYTRVTFYSKYIMELTSKQIVEIVVLIELLIQDLFLSIDNDYNPSKTDIESIFQECKNFQYSNLWIKEEESIKRLLGLISYEITSDRYDSSQITLDYQNNIQKITNRSGLCFILFSLFNEKSFFFQIIKSVLLTKWYFIFEPKTDQIESKIEKPMFLEKALPSSPNFIPLADQNSQNGFQVFFGKTQNTGMDVVGIHPSLFYLFPGLISGSQILLEGYPNPVSVTGVENLTEPLVLTKSKEILCLHSYSNLESIDKIISLGGILIDPHLIKKFDPDIGIFNDWNYWKSRFRRVLVKNEYREISLKTVDNLYTQFFKSNNKNYDISRLISLCIDNNLIIPHYLIPKWGMITYLDLKLILDKFLENESIKHNEFILEYDEKLLKMLYNGYISFTIKEKRIKINNHSEFLLFLLKNYRSSLYNIIKDNKDSDQFFNFQHLLNKQLNIRIAPRNKFLGIVITKTLDCMLIEDQPKKYGILSINSSNDSSLSSEKENFYLQNSFQGELIEKSLLRMKHDISLYKGPNCIFQAPNAQITHFRSLDIETSIKSLKKLGYNIDIDGNPLNSEKQIISLISNDIILPKSLFGNLKKVYDFLDEELASIFQEDQKFDINTQQDLIGHYIVGCNPNSSIGLMGRVIGWMDVHTNGSCVLAHPLWHISRYSSCKNDEPDYYYIFEDLMLNYNVSLLPKQLNGLLGQPIFIKEKIDFKDIYYDSMDELKNLAERDQEKSSQKLITEPNFLGNLHGEEITGTKNIPFTSFNKTKPHRDHNKILIQKVERDYHPENDDISKQMPLEITKRDFSKIIENIQIFEKFNNSDKDFIVILYCNYYLFPRFLAQLNLWLEQPIECPKCKFPYPYAIFKNCTNCGEELKLAYNKDPIINQYNLIKDLLKKFPSNEISESFYYIKNQFKLLFPTNKYLKNN